MGIRKGAPLLALLLTAPLQLLAPSARAADPKALFLDLQKAYDSARDLSAKFTQTSHLVAAGMERESAGRVVFKKGGKMRWTYEGDDPQEIVSDGKTLWIYQVRDRTVMRQDLRKLPPSNRVALDLLSGLQGVTEHFRLGTCGETCLELTPKETRSDLTRVQLELSPKTKEVRTVTTEDTLGNRTRIELKELRWNSGVKDDTFAFKAPKGVQVLEMPGGGG